MFFYLTISLYILAFRVKYFDKDLVWDHMGFIRLRSGSVSSFDAIDTLAAT